MLQILIKPHRAKIKIRMDSQSSWLLNWIAFGNDDYNLDTTWTSWLKRASFCIRFANFGLVKKAYGRGMSVSGLSDSIWRWLLGLSDGEQKRLELEKRGRGNEMRCKVNCQENSKYREWQIINVKRYFKVIFSNSSHCYLDLVKSATETSQLINYYSQSKGQTIFFQNNCHS